MTEIKIRGGRSASATRWMRALRNPPEISCFFSQDGQLSTGTEKRA